MPQKQHKRKPATVNDYSFFVLILILLGGASQTGCYREGQCSAGPGVSPQRTPQSV